METASGMGITFGDYADAYVEGADGSVRMQGIRIDMTALADIDFKVGGKFVIECVDSDGNQRWITDAKNGVTDAGLNSILNVYFRGQTQITAWYLLLVDNAGFSAFADADTMTSHAGWAEVAAINVSDTTRVTWSPGAPSGKAITNATSADYHMIPSSPITVYGVALVSESTKGGTSGLLFSTAPFTTGPQSTKNGDTLRGTYVMAGAST